MSITEKFENISYQLTTDSLRPRIPNRDPVALRQMRNLSDHMANTKNITYGWGSWGFTRLCLDPYQ